MRPLWNKNSWHLCSDCQSCHYQLSRFLPISRLRGLPTNFKFLVFLRVFYICCRLANESTRSNRWDWYILWILVSYLFSSSVKKTNLISQTLDLFLVKRLSRQYVCQYWLSSYQAGVWDQKYFCLLYVSTLLSLINVKFHPPRTFPPSISMMFFHPPFLFIAVMYCMSHRYWANFIAVRYVLVFPINPTHHVYSNLHGYQKDESLNSNLISLGICNSMLKSLNYCNLIDKCPVSTT